jgi:hypothetical protein
MTATSNIRGRAVEYVNDRWQFSGTKRAIDDNSMWGRLMDLARAMTHWVRAMLRV